MERNCGSPFVETKFLGSPRTAAEWEALFYTGGDVPELQESTPSMDVTRSVALVRGGGGDYIVRLDQEAIGAAQMQLTSELETAEFAMFRNPRGQRTEYEYAINLVAFGGFICRTCSSC